MNGLFVGSQVVSGGFCEQRIRVLTGERLGFIEVFSEFGVCLLYTDVTPPPDGLAEQGVRVELSGGRTVSLRLTFAGEDPFVEIVYCDPQLQAASTPVCDAAGARTQRSGRRGRRDALWPSLAPFLGRPVADQPARDRDASDGDPSVWYVVGLPGADRHGGGTAEYRPRG